ncbi:2OG-Fe(II) oxygenase [Streptomyces sp. NPDC059445]|uniref:2OG-Fe(II) oxygenase n=1 Tax=Streptomyces sp. NPDC059445 TaxID=3346832 RepID=UPI0036AD551F
MNSSTTGSIGDAVLHMALSTDPFRHATGQNMLSNEDAERILNWLKVTDEFIPRNEEFYRSSAFHIGPQNSPACWKDVFSSAMVSTIRLQVQELFKVALRPDVYISANCYRAGQGTLIHTDYQPPGKRDEFYTTHRLILYLNSAWDESDGGRLGLFRSAADTTPVATVDPISNSGVALEIRPNSFHAVSAIHGGERYSINFTFVAQDPGF